MNPFPFNKLSAIWVGRLILCVLASGGIACGKSTRSGEMAACDSISLELKLEFLDRGLRLPSAWEELPGIKMIREGSLEMSGEAIGIYNKFAMVPEAPELKNSSAIPKEYVGMRLFLIQRSPEPARIHSHAGRNAILIGPETTNPSERQISSIFLKEEIAEAMLSQIEGFTPENQPLAFDGKFISDSIWRKNGRSEFEAEEQKAHLGKQESDRVIFLVVMGLFLVFGCLVWLEFRFRAPARR